MKYGHMGKLNQAIKILLHTQFGKRVNYILVRVLTLKQVFTTVINKQQSI